MRILHTDDASSSGRSVPILKSTQWFVRPEETSMTSPSNADGDRDKVEYGTAENLLKAKFCVERIFPS